MLQVLSDVTEQSDTYISGSLSDVPGVSGGGTGCSARSRHSRSSTGRGPRSCITWVPGVHDVAVVQTDGVGVAGIHNG